MPKLEHYYPRLKVTSEPASEPVTTAEFRTFAQYEDTDQDTLIDSLIKTARRKVERDCDIALITQTRKAYYSDFPCDDWMEFHVYPVSAVSVSYEDENGATQTLSSSLYTTDFDNLPPRLKLISGQVFPQTEYGVLQAVTVTLTCGFGSASSVPEEAKTAIKFLAREWFYNRCPTGETGSVGGTYGALCDLLRWRPAII